MCKILKNGTIVTSDKIYKADIKIKNGKIVEINKKIECSGAEVISIDGCYLLPGGIDAHTHFDLDLGITTTADDFESGTKAAIAGGTTTIIDFVNHIKGRSLKSSLEDYKNKSNGKCYCDYSFHMSISQWNEDISREMEHMVEEEGITSFKMYTAYKNTLQVEDKDIYSALKKAKSLGALIAFHCENGDLIEERIKELRACKKLSPFYHQKARPPIVEKEAISRVLSIGQLVNYPVFIVHLSSQEGLDEILNNREKGVKVLVETCPQYLLLDNSLYNKDNFEAAKYVISPPLRSKKDNLVLWKALKDKHIQIVSTDHCSFNFNGQKNLGVDDFSKIPNGAPGVEHRIELLYNFGVLKNRINLNRLVEIISTNPAKIYGLYPKKGEIEKGSDADLIVLNPNKKIKISSENQIQNVDYTPYEGFECYGSIDYVFLRGNKVLANGKIPEEKTGQYIKRGKGDYEVK